MEEKEKTQQEEVIETFQEKSAAIQETTQKFLDKINALSQQIEDLKKLDISTEKYNREMAKLQKKIDELQKKMEDWVNEQKKKLEDWLQEQNEKIIQKQKKRLEQKAQMEKEQAEQKAKQILAIKTGIKVD